MKNIASLLLFLIPCLVYSQSSFFEEVDNFMKNYVSAGLVKYDSLKRNPAELNRLVNQIGNFKAIGQDPDVQKAFYTNAYNILVIKQIVDQYPIAGPMEIDGFFNETIFKVNGLEMTLDMLEKEILLPAFPDSRLHFVLVCAAMGCPPIADYAYTPENLDSLIEMKTKEVLNINWYTRIYKNKTEISKVFEWYEEDFLRDTTNIKSYINKYRELKIPESHRLETYEYDWSLNDAKNIRY